MLKCPSLNIKSEYIPVIACGNRMEFLCLHIHHVCDNIAAN